MKNMLMAIMAVAVTFSTPAFAGEGKNKKDEKKGGYVTVYGDQKCEKKDEKNGGYSHVTGFVCLTRQTSLERF